MTIPTRPFSNLSLDHDPRLLRHACLTTLAEAQAEDLHRRTTLLNYLLEAELGTQRQRVTTKALQVLQGLETQRGCAAVVDHEFRSSQWRFAHQGGKFDAIAMTLTCPRWQYPLSALPKAPPPARSLAREAATQGVRVAEFNCCFLGVVLDEGAKAVSLSLTVDAFGEKAAQFRKRGFEASWVSAAGFTAKVYDGEQALKALAAYTLCRPSTATPAPGALDTVTAGLKVLAWLDRRHIGELWSSKL